MTPLEALLPRMEGIPEGPELSALADHLAGGSGRRITEITYAWRDGSPSMAVQTGDARARIWPEKGGLHLIRGPEQIYPYVLYLPEGCRPGGEKRWPVIFFFHGIGDRGDDLKGVLRRGLPAHLEKGRGLCVLCTHLPFLFCSGQDMVSILQLVQNLMHGDEDEEPQSTR